MEVLSIFKKIIVVASVLFAIGAVAITFKGNTYTSDDVVPDGIEQIDNITNVWGDQPFYTVQLPTKEQIEEIKAKLAKLEEYERLEEMEKNKPVSKYASVAELITDEEVALSAFAIYHESRGESYEGQKAVCEVIFNRVLHPEWPNTVKEVLYQPNQFDVASYMLTADINEPELLAQAFRIVYEVLEETEYVLPDSDYIYFAQKVIGKSPIELGVHYFCK